ncbi:transposase [Rhodococcus globerulus]|uniref:transposase n=1 Tax=Rhodococcus globerulus TaxID=33008 RepID=UPI00374E415B
MSKATALNFPAITSAFTTYNAIEPVQSASAQCNRHRQSRRGDRYRKPEIYTVAMVQIRM